MVRNGVGSSFRGTINHMESGVPARSVGEQAALPGSLGRRGRAGRSGLLLRPDDSGHEGAGDELISPS